MKAKDVQNPRAQSAVATWNAIAVLAYVSLGLCVAIMFAAISIASVARSGGEVYFHTHSTGSNR